MNPAAPPKTWTRTERLLLASVLAALVGTIGYMVWTARSDWQRAEEETDALDPRWRMAEMLADRKAVPDAENAALVCIALARRGRNSIRDAPGYDEIFQHFHPPHQMNGQQMTLIAVELAKIVTEVREARKLKAMPNAQMPWSKNKKNGLSELSGYRAPFVVGEWLQLDAYVLAQDDKLADAWECCHAILNAANVLRDEPEWLAMSYHGHCQLRASTTIEHLLAQGEIKDEILRPIQAQVEKNLNANPWLNATRGSRASYHEAISLIRNGKLTPNFKKGEFVDCEGAGNFACETVASLLPKAAPRFCFGDRLRHMNKLVEISKLPIHEQRSKVKDWDKESRRFDNPNHGFSGPTLPWTHDSYCRTQAVMRAACVGLVCERYRLTKGKWPPSLDALVQSRLLESVPADPFDGKPLRYRIKNDGVVIYAVGKDDVDNQGNVELTKWHDTKGKDVGFYLWNVPQRRQPPLPEVVLLDEKKE